MPKLPISQMAQFVVRNPFTAAAAVFAPAFAQNEDRGYFRTALITTPVIFAAGNYGPQLFGGVKGVARTAVETSNLLKNAEKWTRFEQQNYNDLNTLFKDKAAPSNVIDRALSNYLVAERRSRDTLKEQRTLSRLFNRKFAITQDLIGRAGDASNPKGMLKAQARIAEIEALQSSKGRMITNAMQYARRASLTPAEWATETSMMGPAVNMTNDELVSMFDQYSSRPDFVKTLRNRLREVRGLEYGGTVAMAEGGPTAAITSEFPIEDMFNPFDRAESMALGKLGDAAPETLEYLAQAKKLGTIRDVTIIAEAVTKGEIGKVLSVRITRPEGGNIKEFTFPIVDMKTGTVRLSGNSIGVADWVIGPDQQQYRIDTWIAKQLAEQPRIPIAGAYPGAPSLQDEVASHAYWHAGDPMDARRMAELEQMGGESAGEFTARARKLRSFAAKYTKLPLFVNQEGERVAYRDLSAAEQQIVVRRTLNSGQFINMSSEAGTYEGRFVRREAAWLSPYGAPSAEKQDSIWRSVTKEFQLRVGGGYDMPQEAIPGWRSTAWEQLTGGDILPAAKFNVASIDPQVRTAILNEMKGNPLVAPLGRMGETGFVINEGFANNFTVEGIRKYNVQELGVNVGDTVDSSTVMGFRDHDRVVPKQTGVVTDIATDESGYVVNVRHELAMQGAKVDIAGIKGMVPVTPSNEHFEQLRGIINDYYKRTGSDNFIPEGVNALAPTEYFANKLEPAHAYLGIGSDLVNRLPAEVSAEYRAAMESKLATTFQGGQLVIDAAKMQSLKDVDAAQRLRDLSAISEEFFAKAGEAIRTAGGYQDPVLSAFVHSGQDLGNWMMRNQLPAIGFAWDHSLVNAPRFASVTHDIATHMAFGQNFAGLKALQSRVQTASGGSADQSLRFMEHVMGGKFDKPFGNVVKLNEAFPAGRGDLQSGLIRANSIFDPSIAKYEDNFSLDLGNGQFLPVPGTAAYGAESKQFEPGRYQTRDWQHTLHDLSQEVNVNKQAELRATLMDQYKESFGVGKGNVLRPYQQDPMSVAGVFSTIAEEENPFVARVSPEWVKSVRSKKLREALERGEEVLGALHRQPTNQMIYMKYKMDEAMQNTLDVGVAERISRAFIGDQDKDTAYSLLFDANVRTENGKLIAEGASTVEKEAALEAYEKINGGGQLAMLEAWEGVKGTDEVANRVTGFEMKSLASRSEAFAQKVENRVGVAINRTAGASIGSFSNIVTQLNEQMLRTPAVMRDPTLAARLNAIFFDIRQTPISARKSPSFSLEQAMAHIGQLKTAMVTPSAEGAASRTHAALINLGSTLNSSFKETKEYEYLIGQGVEDIQTWARGRSQEAILATQALTGTVDKSRKFATQNVAKNLENIYADVRQTMGPVHLAGSGESATRLGIIAEGLAEKGRAAGASVTGTVGKIFQKHGKAAAIGLGALAALGVAMTSRTPTVATFSRPSGNSFRPEERMGVADAIPGEPVAGQMSGAPPRRLGMAPANVRTAVVAPMGSTSDLSVTMRANDRSKAAETARLMSQIPGSGDTNVTINYRDRTKLRSLRTREKIRGIR